MWSWCLPPSFLSIWLTVPEQIAIEDLQDGRGRCCSKIFKMADNFSNSESLCCSDASHQVLAQSDLWFGRRCHLKNFKMATMILAILNLCVTVMLSIKFWLNPTYGLGGDVVWRISRWQPSWISEWNNFSNSESLCCSNASHQVLAQSHLRFRRRCPLKYFKMAAMAIGWNGMAAIFDIGTEQF